MTTKKKRIIFINGVGRMCILERRRTEVVIMNLLLPVSIQSECDFDKRRTQKITAPLL